jgi:hypothetical protein
MTYRNSYRRGYRNSAPSTGRIARPNKRPGPCRYCQEEIPAMGGQLWREDDGAWSVVHRPAEWAGSPTSGHYVGGCPDETDRMNAQGRFGGQDGAGSERDRIASRAALASAMAEREAPGSRGSKYAYTSTGARMTMSSRRCEDAPCCGCCD